MKTNISETFFASLLWISLLLLQLQHASSVTVQNRRLSPRDFSLWTASEIAETVDRWKEHYPDLLRVFTAQDEYDLPAAGSDSDCPFDEDVIGCLNRVMVLQDFVAHPENSASAQRLPHVLWSGELHGNERVGPTAVMEATKLLLEAASCEGLPREAVRSDKSAWQAELESASACREELRTEYGLTDHQRQWMARLVTTRKLVIVPTANALGYFQNTREESHIDPNRDFPYDSSPECMQTIAARTLNEVFRNHMFQLSLTFHGGMEIIGYEWGAPHYKGVTSPDDQAQTEIAKAYSDFAGGFSGTHPYDYGPMNDQVYPVHGGMEDWAYAASWDPERVIPCNPKTYGGYPTEKTVYSESTLRCYNMLVETSNRKEPKTYLGGSAELLGAAAAGNNGHVARNARLALMALELVAPYVKIQAADSVVLSDDMVPLAPHTCRQMVLPAKQGVPVTWSVGGALTVEETELYVMKEWSNSVSSLCEDQPSDSEALLSTLQRTSTAPLSGKRNEPFQGTVDLSSFREGDVVALVARARVDASWLQGRPMAHIVHTRRDPEYRYETEDGSVMQGRIDWFSQPVIVRIMSSSTQSMESQARFSARTGGPAGPARKKKDSFHPVRILFVLVVLLVGFVAARRNFGYFVRKSRMERIRDFIEDDEAVTPGLVELKGGVVA